MTVKYALKDAPKPIAVATYRITSTLPQELKGQLPDPGASGKTVGGIRVDCAIPKGLTIHLQQLLPTIFCT